MISTTFRLLPLLVLLATHGALSAGDTAGKKREKNETFQYLGFGPSAMTTEDDGTKFAYLASMGKYWVINPMASIKVRADGAINFGETMDGNRYLVTSGLGMNFYYPVPDFTPYIGMDFGFGSAIEHSHGFCLGVNAGLALFRGSGVFLSLEPTVQFVLGGEFPMLMGIKLGVNI